MALGWVPGLKFGLWCLFVWKHVVPWRFSQLNMNPLSWSECYDRSCLGMGQAAWEALQAPHQPSWIYRDRTWHREREEDHKGYWTWNLSGLYPWGLWSFLHACIHTCNTPACFSCFLCMIEPGFACYQSAGFLGRCLRWLWRCWTTTSSSCSRWKCWSEPWCSSSSGFAEPSLHVSKMWWSACMQNWCIQFLEVNFWF